MKKLLLIASLGFLASCGGETVYIVTESTKPVQEEATETTVQRTTTTRPAETRPPASAPATSSYYSPELYDDFLWESVNEFWWLFTEDQLLQMGLLVCQEFDRGQTLDQVTESLIGVMSNTSTLYLSEGMAAVTAGALTFLCPEHGWWLETI